MKLTALPSSSSSLGQSVLELLAGEGQPVPRSEIKQRLGLAESHLSHLLRDLEAAELVVRLRAEKGREVMVDLGPEGRRIAATAVLPRWVSRLTVLIGQAADGTLPGREELARDLQEAGAPSRLAAERLADALARPAAPQATRPGRIQYELREPARDESRGADLAGPSLQPWLESAAAQRGLSVREYVREALRDRLAADGALPEPGPRTPAEAARLLDTLRKKVGPIGSPVRELILEGRRR